MRISDAVFSFRNMKKSHTAKSGEYNGRSNGGIYF